MMFKYLFYKSIHKWNKKGLSCFDAETLTRFRTLKVHCKSTILEPIGKTKRNEK